MAQLAFADLDDERDVGTPAKTNSGPPPKKPSNDAQDVAPNLGAPSDARKANPPPSQPGLIPLKTNPNQKKPKSSPGATQKEAHDSKQPIKWEAKGLKGSKDSKILELVRDVVVTQGNVKLEADNAKVFFNDQNEVTKVLAFGRKDREKDEKKEKEERKEKDTARNGVVKMTKETDLPQDRISARGNEAIFDNTKRTVTLLGNAALWRGGDVVRGKQIVYNLDSGWINVDSVEGVVQPGEQQKNEFKSP